MIYLLSNDYYIVLKIETNVQTTITINLIIMEKRINQKIDVYISKFKDDIKQYIISSSVKDNGPLVQYIYYYESLCLSKDDFVKRKRLKNTINLTNRCCAKRANNEQCTRRKKENEEYCGTHMKGTPHGIVNISINDLTTHNTKINAWAQDIKGIIYYIDDNNNVYNPEDVHKNKINPDVIAKYVKNNNVYSIPEFNL